mmetsp:Transcript_27207/g.71697  ORF Transcript_27207/g.71697 Transcript_27207/m.71697 type:complete len:94 (-) Transcript_27207:61-342(-)
MKCFQETGLQAVSTFFTVSHEFILWVDVLFHDIGDSNFPLRGSRLYIKLIQSANWTRLVYESSIAQTPALYRKLGSLWDHLTQFEPGVVNVIR